MDINMLRSAFTVVMFVMFIGIVLWAWSGKRARAFREAANLPFEEDELPAERASRERGAEDD